MTRLYIMVLLMLGTMGMIAAALPQQAAKSEPAAITKQAQLPPVEAEALMLKRDGSGQFHLSATVNNSEVSFLVDTGADLVALTQETAQNLNLNVSDSDFEPIMQTASGVGYGAMVHLDAIEVAGATLRNIDAVVVKDLSVNLLGQTVLRQLGGIELRGDTMLIRAHP